MRARRRGLRRRARSKARTTSPTRLTAVKRPTAMTTTASSSPATASCVYATLPTGPPALRALDEVPLPERVPIDDPGPEQRGVEAVGHDHARARVDAQDGGRPWDVGRGVHDQPPAGAGPAAHAPRPGLAVRPRR